MATIKPYYHAAAGSLIANFADLQLLWHWDDVIAGGNTWTDRIGGVVATLPVGVFAKDANGLYVPGGGATTVTTAGPMPIPTGFMVAVAIGRPTAASATSGLATTIGGASGDGLAANGLAYHDSTAQNTEPSVSVATLGLNTCQVTAFDMAASTNQISRCLANANGESSQATGSTIVAAPIAITQLSSALSLQAFASEDARRLKVIALFKFARMPSVSELRLAALAMARTGELYGGWGNAV